MKSLTILLLFVMNYSVLGAPKIGTEECPKLCPSEYQPVCATLKQGNKASVCTFQNLCALGRQACLTKRNWRMDSNEPCHWPTGDCKSVLRSSKPKPKKFVTDYKDPYGPKESRIHLSKVDAITTKSTTKRTQKTPTKATANRPIKNSASTKTTEKSTKT